MNKDVIYNALCSVFSLIPSSSEASSFIIPAYQKPEEAKMAPKTRNLLYFYSMPVLGESVQYLVRNLDNARYPIVEAPVFYKLVCMFYGPDALDNAFKTRSLLFVDGSGCPLSIFRKSGYYLVPDPPFPDLLYEDENNYYRKRADLSVYVYAVLNHKYGSKQGIITVPPVVNVRK